MARFLFVLTAIWIVFASAASAQNAYLSAQWPNTDFSKKTIDLSEIKGCRRYRLFPRTAYQALDQGSCYGALGHGY